MMKNGLRGLKITILINKEMFFNPIERKISELRSFIKQKCQKYDTLCFYTA
ncbi:hypothetical protein [Xenorhabdus bakwenae]|uniref:hypothetical protein n=1 Tax=Xenorhabdus bakwenae TaxID=3026967 RepID=UPI000AE0D92E|nr:hypothetical protein [Xenorhabdus sp. SF857]